MLMIVVLPQPLGADDAGGVALPDAGAEIVEDAHRAAIAENLT